MSAAVEHVPGCGEALAARDCHCWRPSRRSRSKRPVVSSDPIPVDRQYWYQSVAENEQQLRVRTYMLHSLVPHWVAAIESALLAIRRELDQWGEWEHRCYSRWHVLDDTHVAQQRQFRDGSIGRCTCGSFSWLNMPTMRSVLVDEWWLWLHPDVRRYWNTTRTIRFGDFGCLVYDAHARPGTSITRVER